MERIRSTPTLTTIPRPIMLRLRVSAQPTSRATHSPGRADYPMTQYAPGGTRRSELRCSKTFLSRAGLILGGSGARSEMKQLHAVR